MWESGGPTQLSNTDPVNIVDNYSVYGYMAVAATFTDGLLPVKLLPREVTMNDEQLLAQLRNEVSVPSGDDERLTAKLAAAKAYVASAVGAASIKDEVLADCIVSCAADLYNSRDARLGVMDVGDGTTEPFRISTDPLRSVWPKLKAAGVNTGGLVIA